MTTVPLLTAKGIGKRFGALVALSGIDLEIRSGEVLALVGDNGAGKSTFIKILSAPISRARGNCCMDGEPVAFASPQDAADVGIATIFQELALSENLSIAENVFLGSEIVRRVPACRSSAGGNEAEGRRASARRSKRMSRIRRQRSAAFPAGSGRRWRFAAR